MSKKPILNLLVAGTAPDRDMNRLLTGLCRNYRDVNLYTIVTETPTCADEAITWAAGRKAFYAGVTCANRKAIESTMSENGNPSAVVIFDTPKTDRATRNVINAAKTIARHLNAQTRIYMVEPATDTDTAKAA